MIPMERYQKETEEKYWECVEKTIAEEEQINLIESCKKYMPQDFFPKGNQKDSLKALILAPYEKLKCAHEYFEKNRFRMEAECFQNNNDKDGKRLTRTPLYDMLYKKYEAVTQKMIDGIKMNIFLVQQTGLTVCPYCNRDYINCRSETFSGAQLDHFYPRSKYPVFSVCLYNLIPSCGNCNRIKSDNDEEYASPFDETIDWENALTFSYVPLGTNRQKIVINAKQPIRHNIETMHIEDAYQIHEPEVKELLEKIEMYSDTQLEEFKKVLGKETMTEMNMKKMVFGPEITKESMKKKPLGRMLRDLERELGIYSNCADSG